MAIVKMNKISIIGLNKEKPLLVKEIMDLGVVEISSQDYKLTEPDWISYVKKDGDENEVFNYDSRISTIGEALAKLDRYDTGKRPLLSTRKTITSSEFEQRTQEDTAEKNVKNIVKLSKELNDLSTEENKTEAAIMSLRPWYGYELPMELSETKYTSIFKGTIPGIVEVEKLRNSLVEKAEGCHLSVISGDKDQHYISVICLNNEKDEVFDVLKQYGFNASIFKDIEGTAAENIIQYEKRLKEIGENKAAVEKGIAEAVPFKEDIQILYDHLIIERDKIKVLDRILRTETSFYIQGWIPAKSKDMLEKLLDKRQCWYEITEPDKDEQHPILLYNTPLTEPLEAVTELYSLPTSSNIDPTAAMWFFFILFFGIMFGDVGYGLILIVATGILIKKFKVEGSFGKMAKTLFFAGISTAFWGVMFGSWFGDAIPAAAKVFFNIDFVLKPAWLNPLEEPMTVLVFSFALGLIHLFVGLGLKAYILIRDGYIKDAIFDVGFWYLFIIGPIMLLLGGMLGSAFAQAGKYITAAGAIGLILTQGRAKKGIISKLFSGILSLYGITGYLSDVLSYSRLLALGLATGVVSSVLSIIGSMGGHSIIGAILFIVVFTLGHSFNFAINVLGSFVHSARLQYVEFFGKFYEGGGEPFDPLIKRTKYIKIIREEN